MSGKKKKFGKRPKGKEDMVLQITSMADIFTILLVFLLKSFSTGVSTITPTSGMVLPESQKPEPMISETLKVEISEKSILMDDKAVTELRNFALDPNDLERDGTPRSLNTALIKQRQKDTTQKFPRLM